MEDTKFIFVGDRASFGPLALEYGSTFDADADFIRGQGFPAVPDEMLTSGYTRLDAAAALEQFRNPQAPKRTTKATKQPESTQEQI